MFNRDMKFIKLLMVLLMAHYSGHLYAQKYNATDEYFKKDDYFLTDSNPLATSDQLEIEALSLKLVKTPQVQKAKTIAAMRVKSLVHGRVPDEAWERFDEVMDEWTLGYVQKAINADPNYPKVLSHLFSAPYEWFGQRMPGNRAFGGENPDTIYNAIPIDHYARYRLVGKKFNDKYDAPIQICSNFSLGSTVGMLSWEDVHFEDDGTFVITIDPQPANGRVNHIQSKPESKYIHLRYTRSDWTAKPIAYRIERLDPPLAEPLTLEEITDLAALIIVDDVPASLYWLSMIDELEPNKLKPPLVTGNVGGMWTARMSFGNLAIEDDEAFVLNVDLADARFFNVVLYDYWQITLDYGNRLTSSNGLQGHRNPDGTMTFVVSKTDPGVYNWIDTAGLHYPKIMLRWQQLPRDANARTPTIEGELIKLNELKKALPSAMKFVTAEERQQQLQERMEAHQTRYLDR
jgi:hypothetical protein